LKQVLKKKTKKPRFKSYVAVISLFISYTADTERFYNEGLYCSSLSLVNEKIHLKCDRHSVIYAK